MKQDPKPFVPLDADIVDADLERLAGVNGVPSFVKATDNAPPATSNSTIASATDNKTPRSRMKTLSLELPDYAWTELKIRAAKDQVSLRHIVMTALLSYGVQIAPDDMIEDGRRLR